MFEERNTAELAQPARTSGQLATTERPIVLTAKVDASCRLELFPQGIRS
jgi:hypothetical protein